MDLQTVGKIFLLLVMCISVRCHDLELRESLKQLNAQNFLERLTTMDSNTICMEDLKSYLNSITSKTWAQLMFDSTAKIPDGVLIGNSKILGQYDECVDVEDPEINFVGQHCMMNIKLKLGLGSLKTYKKEHWSQNIEKAVTSELTFFYGVCLPSSCSAEEIETRLGEALNNTTLSVKVDPQNCKTKEPKPLGSGEWVVITILIQVGVIAIASTIYDVVQRQLKKNNNPHSLLSAFSIYTNGKRLFTISESSGQMKSLHGLRTLSMAWVVLCHAYASGIAGPAVNFAVLPKLMMDKPHILVSNGFVSVDSFFFLSGLLVCFVFFRDIGKNGTYDVPLGYIHRYLRLTPPFAMMILLRVTILTYIGNGPLWHTLFDGGAQTCSDNWWSGLLYVQNFVHPQAACLGQSWYLSADMQMYWISPLILYPMLLWPMIGPYFIGVLTLVVTSITFTIAYVNDLGPGSLITPDSAKQMDLDYTKFYTRITPWLIGVAVGYLICGIQAKKIKMKLSAWQVVCGWILCTGIALGCIYGIVPFQDPEYKSDYTSVQSAFYLALHRLGWGLALAWIVFACTQGYGGLINSFLSWGIFQPLGKLSYCTFLIHLTIQEYRIGVIRTNTYIGDLELVYSFLGDWMLANLLSIPFTLLFEMPFFTIERYLFQDVKILQLPKPRNRSLPQQKTKIDEETGKDNPSFVNST